MAVLNNKLVVMLLSHVISRYACVCAPGGPSAGSGWGPVW